MNRSTAIFAILAGLIIAAPTAAFAIGGGNSKPATKPVCKKGYVYSKKKKRCVRQSSQVVPDRSLIEQGWALAYNGKYQLAADLFHLVRNKENPEALNGLGYSHRKLGQLERGISYYKQALAIDPDYVLAREYLGEGYVKAGNIELAKFQLAEIKKRCGTACKEYRLLARAISTGSENDW